MKQSNYRHHHHPNHHHRDRHHPDPHPTWRNHPPGFTHIDEQRLLSCCVWQTSRTNGQDLHAGVSSIVRGDISDRCSLLLGCTVLSPICGGEAILLLLVRTTTTAVERHRRRRRTTVHSGRQVVSGRMLLCLRVY